ncbi:hypothetical protein AS850_15305 [Frondihabitans sp. 762G35]|uniref:hypothetical protein n=1 Tax=Frondihabitans sp. 762G35 TaxID=1446794 RepID=UPI000D2072A1|nr:hypothetical protein [Frondihabitans sp. 762G35]ARC58453.1 hypothetical protein AS850_15305 [Frondihabitans sp. 762G35]
MTTRFRERMVGPVARILGAPAVDLPERGDVRGDDIVELARGAALAPFDDAPALLDLDRLLLRLDALPDARDGYRATVAEGLIRGLGHGIDGPVVTGFADLLPRTGPSERRMYYRLVCGTDATARHVIEGVKVVRGGYARAWSETTTLFTRVSRADEHASAALLRRPDRAAEGLVPVRAGILRIRPADLARQVASMRGGVPRFLVGFAVRLRRD